MFRRRADRGCNLSQEEASLGSTDIELSLVWFDVSTVVEELAEVVDVNGVVSLFSNLVSNADERVRTVPVRFPVVLSLGLVPAFARSALWSLGVGSAGTAYVVFSTGDGKVLDIGVPSNFMGFVPKWAGPVASE